MAVQQNYSAPRRAAPGQRQATQYVMTPTAAAFHNSNAKYRFVFGPVGAGKTVFAVPMELLFRMCQQQPNAAGVRKTRWLVARRSYPQLVTTTIKTFMEWIGHLGKLKMSGSPITWEARFALPDGTTVETEVWFKSLDKAEDIDDLKSMELTGAVLSECAEMPKVILDVLKTRLNRYPRDPGPTWTGIWGESNPPSIRSHWYDTLEKERPAGYQLFRQPPPLFYNPENPDMPWIPNPMAENIRADMGGYGYYLDMIPGMDWDRINVFILGNYGTVKSGKPVYPEYQEHYHKALGSLNVERGRLVVVGMDFGLDASAVPTQVTSGGSLMTFPEILAEGMGLEEFIQTKLAPVLRTRFAGCSILVVGDPSSDRRETVSQYNAFNILQRNGLAAQKSMSNDPRLREEAVRHFLMRRDGFFLDRDATVLHEGFTGGYQYKDVTKGAETSTVYRAVKNQFSHPHDALQYAALYYYKGSMVSSTRPPPSTGRKQLYVYV